MKLFSHVITHKKYVLSLLVFLLFLLISLPGLIASVFVIPCRNTSGFLIPKDLQQAYTFILKKGTSGTQLDVLLSQIPHYSKCLNIDRADLDEQNSGFAIFFPDSMLTRLRIYIDFLYQSHNMIMTGYILVGKLARANDFILSRSGIASVSCSQQNIHEAQAQLAYLVSLTPQEMKTLHLYITNEFYTYKDLITKKILSEQLDQIQICRAANLDCTTTISNYPKIKNLTIDSENQCFSFQ